MTQVPIIALTRRGDLKTKLVAFDRGGVIPVATRLPVTLARHGGWRDTVLRAPCHHFHDAVSGRSFTGSPIPIQEILASYPVALLVAR